MAENANLNDTKQGQHDLTFEAQLNEQSKDRLSRYTHV